MTWTVPEPVEPTTTHVAGEREMLESWLDFHRTTLLHKCAGLTGEQLAMRSVEPSSLSLLGLLRHMAEVERGWFRKNIAGEDVPWIYCLDPAGDADFDDIDPATAETDHARFVAECQSARDAVAGRSLDDTFIHPRRGTTMSVRWVYVHMIEEYARHNGHADLLRERIDGRVDE